MYKQSEQVRILMNINHEVKVLLGQYIYDPVNLYDLLMDRMERTPAFLEYTYEVIILMVQEKMSIHELISEYQRLLQLKNLSEEFQNPNQWEKISNF